MPAKQTSRAISFLLADRSGGRLSDHRFTRENREPSMMFGKPEVNFEGGPKDKGIIRMFVTHKPGVHTERF